MDRKSGWMPHRAGARGFTLVELMIAVLLLVIVLAVAAPPLRQLVHGNRLRTEASRLLRALNLARSEAVRYCRAASGGCTPVASPGELPAYVARNWPAAAGRLQQAGVRLAALLNAHLSP